MTTPSGFELYTRGARRKSEDPTATLTKVGMLRLNEPARLELERLAGRRVLGGDSLVLAWRADPRAIGVRVGRRDDAPSALHTAQSDGGSLAVNAAAFCRAHDLVVATTTRSMRYPVQPRSNLHEFLVIDLSVDGEDVTRTIRSRSERTR